MLRIGLNPYGLTFHLGLQGAGTPRGNPHGAGLEGFTAIAREIGAKTLELHGAWLHGMAAEELRALRGRIERLGMTPVVGTGLPQETPERAIAAAAALGATIVRLALTPVLCGDRAALGAKWPDLVASVRAALKRWAPVAAERGIVLAIENHQDFRSAELVAFCEEAGNNVGICFDTGNAFPVGEAPLDFARTIAAHVRHLHLKDYQVQRTEEGFRLVRCAIGDGAVPFAEIAALLAQHHTSLTASLEPGALEARHVRLLRPEWWGMYPPLAASALAACLAATQRNQLADDADFRTPWEREADAETLVDYELAMIRRSAANMRALGLMH
jgi:3-oxoisoapionate decarboxylase